MSGGSYNYLYRRDAEDLVEHYDHHDRSDLGRMIERLRSFDADDVADELLDAQLTLRSALRRVDVVMRRCADVMHAVEWCDSSDYSDDDVAKALAEHRHPDEAAPSVRCVCPTACDCQNPEPVDGTAGVSMACPIHNDRPRRVDGCEAEVHAGGQS